MPPLTYKIACAPLGIVVLLKTFSQQEELDLWNKLAGSLDRKVRTFKVQSYKEALVNEFVVDFIESVKEYEEEEIEAAINFLYDQIVTMFPPFKLEIVCLNVNTLNAKKILLKPVSSLESGDYNPPLNPLDGLMQDENEMEVGNRLVQWGTKEGIQKIEKYLKTKVIGQDLAIDSVMRVLKLHASELVSHSSLFFVGPTGVAKSYLGKLLGKKYSGNFFKIDCEAYSERHDKATLTGSPPGYIGSQEKSILADKASKSNAWVILFDEIEKANEKFRDLLLGLMDEGVIADSSGKILDFSKSIFIFTSNQGITDIRHGRNIGFSKDDNDYTNQLDKIKESIEKNFKPEFLNRIDEIIYFNELTEEDSKKIALLELKEFPVKRTKELIDYVVKGGFSKKYGARNLKRFIKNNIGIKIAESIIDRKIPSTGRLYNMELIEGNLIVTDIIDYDTKVEIKVA